MFFFVNSGRDAVETLCKLLSTPRFSRFRPLKNLRFSCWHHPGWPDAVQQGTACDEKSALQANRTQTGDRPGKNGKTWLNHFLWADIPQNNPYRHESSRPSLLKTAQPISPPPLRQPFSGHRPLRQVTPNTSPNGLDFSI